MLTIVSFNPSVGGSSLFSCAVSSTQCQLYSSTTFTSVEFFHLCDTSHTQVAEEVDEAVLVGLLKLTASQLKDQRPESRDSARKIASWLYSHVSKDSSGDNEAWDNFCSKNLLPTDVQAVQKAASA